MQSMAKMAQQMELFDDGGLMDEGGTTDPVSGNEVPPGSTQEEVRDDIPAQLSEGEFVVPADVVRYVGLENLMRMRQEAKQGLAEMEAMGQMGNSEEATMPDDLPFDEYDLEVEDDGQGELNLQTGGFIPPSFPNQVNPQTGVYTLPGTGITGFQQYQQQPTGFTPTSAGIPTPYFQPVQFSGPQFTTALQTTNLPTFAETVGSQAGQYDELRTYQNDAGQTLQIPFKNGQPIYPIPEGYKPMADQPKPEEEQPTVTPTLGQTQVRDDGGRDEDTSPSVTTTGTTLGNLFSTKDTGFPKSGLTEQASFNAFAKLGEQPTNELGQSKYGLSNEAYRSAVSSLGLNQLGSLSPTGAIVGGLAGKLGFDETARAFGFNEKATVGNQVRQNALATLGMISPSQMYSNPQATYVGQAMQIATEAYSAGKSIDEVSAALSEHVANNAGIIRATANEISRAYLGSKGFSTNELGAAIGDMSNIGQMIDNDIAEINANLTSAFGSKLGSPLSSAEYANITNQDIKGQYNNFRSRTDLSKPNVFTYDLTPKAKRTKAVLESRKAQLEAIKQANKVAKEAEEARARQQAEMRARQKAEAEVRGFTAFGDYSQEGKSDQTAGDTGPGGTGEGIGTDATGSTGRGTGTDCLTENMKVKLNGVIDFVTNIKVGDMIDGSVVKEVLHKHMRSGYFVINNELEITNDHPVWAKSGGLGKADWTRPEQLVVGDTINGVKVTSLNYINRMTPTVSIVIDGDSFDVYTEGNTYTVHGRYREVRQQAA